MSNYTLFDTVLTNSVSKDWDLAVLEWEIIDCEEDESCGGQCICGKENIRYLFTIKNKENDNELFPIGSSCIKKFGNTELSELTKIYESEFKLFHAVSKNEFIDLKSGLFSKKLIKCLYEEGAFNNSFNQYNGINDYNFFLKMFNKRNAPTINQTKKINAIILNSIKPFIQNKLAKKIN